MLGRRLGGGMPVYTLATWMLCFVVPHNILWAVCDQGAWVRFVCVVASQMRLIAQLKHDVRLFADESLAGFKHRMHSEVKEVVDMARKLDDREAALHAQVAQLQQEQLVVVRSNHH